MPQNGVKLVMKEHFSYFWGLYKIFEEYLNQESVKIEEISTYNIPLCTDAIFSLERLSGVGLGNLRLVEINWNTKGQLISNQRNYSKDFCPFF